MPSIIILSLQISRVLRYHLNPEESVFIDDNARNLETAKSRGMHTILFADPKEGYEKALKLLKL